MTVKPIYSQFDHEQNEWLFGLSDEDFEKVRQGYACSKCLEDYGGLFLPRCPVCKNETLLVQPLPREWRKQGE